MSVDRLRTELTVPDEALGPDGSIVIERWLKHPGEHVEAGDRVAELSIHSVGRVLVNKPEHWKPFVLTSPASGYLITVLPERKHTDMRGKSLGIVAEAPLDEKKGSTHSIYEGTSWFANLNVADWTESVSIVRWLRGSGEQITAGEGFVELEYHGTQVVGTSSVAGHLIYTLPTGHVAARSTTVATVFCPCSSEILVPINLMGGASNAIVKKWLKSGGERVEAHEVFIELECNGTPMPIGSALAGYIEINVPEGQIVKPGMVLGFLCYNREDVLSRHERLTGILLPWTVLPDNEEWERRRRSRSKLNADMLQAMTDRYACSKEDAELFAHRAFYLRSHIRNFVARSFPNWGLWDKEFTEQAQEELVSLLANFKVYFPAVYGGAPEPERIPGLTRYLSAQLVPTLAHQYSRRLTTTNPVKLLYRRNHM